MNSFSRNSASKTTGQAADVDTPFRRLIGDFVESKLAVGALVVFVCIVLVALLSPWISPQNPYDLAEIDVIDGRLPPGSKGINGMTYWLGTDDQGRDMLSAIFYGLRISLVVGVMSGFAALILGTLVGLVGAYLGGKTDDLLMRLVDLQLGFPSILIAMILLAVLGRGVDKMVIALVMTQWAYFARTVRATALSERKKEYIEAAECLVLSQARVTFRHLLPNCLPPLIVVGTVNVAHAIALEATLSFLGIGLPITEPSLGLLISNGYEYILSGRYWISTSPGIALFITIASINLVADQFREVLNPRLQT
jgi:peptide/nickel transport system permease protein